MPVLSTNFQILDQSTQRDSLGRIVLTATISESGRRGPTGKSAYDAWLDLGNTGTEAEFLQVMADSVRPQFREFTLQSDAFALPEVPLDSEALTAAVALDAAVGDVLVYETPYSLTGFTVGPVRYQWDLVEIASSLGVERRQGNIPVYTRVLQQEELRPGFQYKIDALDGLYPHEWIVNQFGSPVELYINPSVDYEILDQQVAALEAKIRGTAVDSETLGLLRESIDLISATYSGGSTDFTAVMAAIDAKEDIGVAQSLLDAHTQTLNSTLDAINPEKRIGNQTGYLATHSPIVSPAGEQGSYFVVLEPVTVDGISVEANTVLRLNQDSTGGIVSNWDVDPVMSAMLRGGSSAVKVETVVLPLLAANTWVPFPANTITTLHSFEIKSSLGEIVTDAYEFRDNSGVYEIRSFIEQTDLQFKLIGN